MRSVTFAIAIGAVYPVGLIAQSGRAASREAQALETAIERLFELDVSPGMAVAAVRGTEVVFARGFGVLDIDSRRPVTPESIFYIGSHTKALTAFAAAVHHQSGRLDLDAPLAAYLPDVALRPPLSARTITLRHLLTHTHGIREGGPIVLRTAFTGDHDPALLLRLLANYEPSATGRVFTYGNLGYNVAGLALEARLGGTWQQILSDAVLRPLGMNDTSAYISKVDAADIAIPYATDSRGYRRLGSKTDSTMHAAGGHVSTVLDLARWLEAHLSRGRVDGREIFPASVIAETHRQQASQDRTFAAFRRYGWSLGWDLGTYDGDTLIHRFGSFPGYRSHVSFMPDRSLGVVVLTNESTTGSTLADAVATTMYDILRNTPDRARRLESSIAETRAAGTRVRDRQAQAAAERAARPQQLPLPPAAYVGTYHNEIFGCLDWQAAANGLRARMGVAQSDVIVSRAEQQEVQINVGGGLEAVTFDVSNGQATALTFRGARFPRQSCR